LQYPLYSQGDFNPACGPFRSRSFTPSWARNCSPCWTLPPYISTKKKERQGHCFEQKAQQGARGKLHQNQMLDLSNTTKMNLIRQVKKRTRWQRTAFNRDAQELLHSVHHKTQLTCQNTSSAQQCKNSTMIHRWCTGRGRTMIQSTKASAWRGILDSREVLFASLGVRLHRPLPRLPSGRADLIWVLLDVLQRLMKH
jgi:hypothetical protein